MFHSEKTNHQVGNTAVHSALQDFHQAPPATRRRRAHEQEYPYESNNNATILHNSTFELEITKTFTKNQDHDMKDEKKTEEEVSLETCFPHNSKEWLHGKRLGNFNDPLLNEQGAVEMILNTPKLLSGGTMHTLLKRTICHEKSRFVNWTDDGSDAKSLHFWTLRLMYLAFHVHQHKPAMKEAEVRQKLNGKCAGLLKLHRIGDMDYECPEAKFLIVPMGELGLGAVMRLGAVNGLLAGMASNRTVLFLNNSPVGDKNVKKPWVHASCPRRDIQCFYLPHSPCVLTHNEIKSAHVLERGEMRKLFKTGELPAAHVNDRALVLNIVLRPQRVPDTLRPNLRSTALSIVEEIREADSHDPRLEIMERAVDDILEQEPDDDRYYYFGAGSKMHHAAVFYSMRPNLSNARRLDIHMSKVFPAEFDPEFSLGLPVRASDKCLMESECLSFPQYMKLMGQVWTNNQGPIRETANRRSLPEAVTNAHIVLTTEAESIFRDKAKFESDPQQRKSVPFDYQFVTNDEDVRQGTGLPANFGKHVKNVTADDIMLSAVSSIQTQLMARFTVGNCCSNFHLLLFDFLRDGCGAARDNDAQCLQENKDPEFRVCCQWSKTDECIEKKKAKEEKEKKK